MLAHQPLELCLGKGEVAALIHPPSPSPAHPRLSIPRSPGRRRGTLKELGFQVGSGFKRLSHVLTAHAEMRDAHAAAADRPPAHHDLSLMQAMCPCGGPPKVRC